MRHVTSGSQVFSSNLSSVTSVIIFCVVKQGCPLSPLLLPIYLNDIDSVTDGVQVLLKDMLFADDLSLPSNEQAILQTMLNKLRVYAERRL